MASAHQQKHDVLVHENFKCYSCFSELSPLIFEAQEGLCKNCIPEGPLKSAAQVRELMLHAEPSFPNKCVNQIRDVKIDSAEHLQKIVECAFDLVLRDAVDEQTHDDHVEFYSRLGQTYADIMFCLRLVVPAFPVANDKPKTFTRILLNVTQDKFEEMVKKLAAPAESDEIDNQVFSQLIALVSFIGHLYVRKLVAARVMAQVVHDLVGVRDRFPAKTLIQCVVELMYVIGKTIDGNKQGNMLMTQFIARLNNLAATTKKDGTGSLYDQQVRSLVSSLYNTRNVENWPLRAGTQIMVQYSEVSLEDAKQEWHNLKAEQKLSPEQMKLEHPKGNEADKGSHIKITNMIKGSVMGVVFNVQDLPVVQEEASEAVGKLKDEMSNALSVHPARFQIFATGLDGEPVLLQQQA
jgi:hypothetical protein